MAINEWSIWKKLGLVKVEPLEEVKIKDDLGAVITFLKEIEVKDLILHLRKMKEMIKEEGVVKEELKDNNLKKQIEFFDIVLQKYDVLQSDADINGLRLKKIAKELLKKAKQRGMADLIEEKKKTMWWR